jgi:hypothetical protein
MTEKFAPNLSDLKKRPAGKFVKLRQTVLPNLTNV